MPNVFDTLKERGFVAQCTNEQELHDLFDKERVTFYIGFDPTADSLHAGHFIALMAMAHLQRAGHRAICLVGGGTGTVGDPTGRTDMRKMLTDEQIEHNCECFKKQMSRFIDFSDGKAIMANNGDWLRSLNYIDMLRDVGACFTVNRMLAAECYKQRWEKGLTFLEFNYMVMQAYDFLELNRRYGCKLQMGGDDQWSNIIAGVELNRRKNGTAVYGLTNKLLTKSDGKKMGKTAGGAAEAMPEVKAAAGEKLLDVLTAGKVFASKGEGRRLIKQNGLALGGEKVTDEGYVLTDADFEGERAVVRKGKKTFATFTMIWSGLFILGFLVQHLMMLKFGEHYLYMNDKGEIVRDMWLTTIQMLGNPAWAAFYVISMFVIGMHLFHAISSAFQTMGIAHQKWTPVIDLAGIVYSVVVALGFAVTAAGAFYLANQPETQALIEKSRSLQPQYEQQLKAKEAAKTSYVVPSVGTVEVSFNA